MKRTVSFVQPRRLTGGRHLINRFFLLALTSCTFFVLSCEKAPEEEIGPAEIAASNRPAAGMIGINVVLNAPITEAALAELNALGTVLDVLPQIRALTMRASSSNLQAIQKLSFVEAANPDAARQGSPLDAVAVADFSNGLNTWNLDAINVTDLGQGRTIAQDGNGVFIGVLDTGLLDSWRQYFPQERIATQYARSFGGGGGERGTVSDQPNKWEHDQDSHGTHVTSTIIGYNLGGTSINGAAPMATIIPVKVLGQNGSGWSSVVARGIMYMAELKAGVLKDSPVVINMSLGGPVLDAIEKAAMDYAISQGVIIVASAGNRGTAGMGYPGAYEPVISVASASLNSAFVTPTWWYSFNVADPTNVADFFISTFSSRAKSGQDLDVTAPGQYIVGPYQLNSGTLSYYYLSGTSMASPHVAGIVALMAQKDPTLTAERAERILEAVALPMATPEAAGHGFITADAALAGMDSQTSSPRRPRAR
ncbi:S8 family peptidase [Cesiribacter andamanensis]|uniref:Subtilisin DY n=1 Tax=Cesiribacter andamanensis AMV16 TaxID=1279009 RepID=M7NB07_9BACT|nr:S8 family serine peptidase [Cesiribacter andamanensis]EMR04371.1 Subtilisin DY [Cesiribacter andamanensis AMV16]